MSKKRLTVIAILLLFAATIFASLIFPRKQVLGESVQVQILEHLYKPFDLIFFHLAFSKNNLPAYEITTSEKDLLKLYDTLPKSKDKEEILKMRYIEDRVYVPATLKFKGKEYKARLTVKGGIPRHYLGEKKSYRVRVDNDQKEPFSGINFIIPEDDNFIDIHVSYFLSKKFNVFMPKPDFAKLYINGVNYGVYKTYQDDQDNSTIELSGLSTNDLFFREEAKPQVVAQGTLSDLFGESGAWKLTNSPETDDPAPLSAIEKLRKVNKLEGNEFYENLKNMVDIDQFARFLAQIYLLGDFHQSSDANQVLLYLKEKGKLWFVPDENVISPIENLQGLHFNNFYEKALYSPEIYWKRNESLWHFTESVDNRNELEKYLEDIYNTIKAPLYQDSKKAFRFLAAREKIKSQNKIIVSNFDKVKSYFETYYIESNVKKLPKTEQSSSFAIKIKANSFFQPIAKSMTLQFKDNTQAIISFSYDANGNEKVDEEDELISTAEITNVKELALDINFPLKADKFLESPVDRLRPTIVTNLIMVSDSPISIEQATINFTSSFDGSDLISQTNLIDGSLFVQKPPLPAFIKREVGSKFTIGPGVIPVSEDVFIPEGELEIKAGTTLVMAPYVSIISEALVIAKGTPSSPITIGAQNPNQKWGSFLVIGPHEKKSEFDNVRIDSGSGIKNYGLIATGALAIHFADATITNSYFAKSGDDDALNIKHGKAEVKNNIFEDNFHDAVDFDSVTGVISDNQFRNNGGDSIDTSFSNLEISRNNAYKSSDKCLSIGESSNVQIQDNILSTCDIGVAVKDGAKAAISGNSIKNNRLAITGYMKKSFYQKGGEIILGQNILQNNGKDSEIDEYSNIQSLRE